MSADNLYCKIFADTPLKYDCFFDIIKNYTNGRKQAVSFIRSDWCIISISRNKEYIPRCKDFLYWKYIIDIDINNVPEKIYMKNIKSLVYFLEKNNISTVCACDFEDFI